MKGERPAWRSSFLVEYYGEAAIPWLVAMSYKAVRTARHNYIDWTQHPESDELYDLVADAKEEHDLADKQADRVEKMKTALADWQKSVARSLNGEDYGAKE